MEAGPPAIGPSLPLGLHGQLLGQAGSHPGLVSHEHKDHDAPGMGSFPVSPADAVTHTEIARSALAADPAKSGRC